MDTASRSEQVAAGFPGEVRAELARRNMPQAHLADVLQVQRMWLHRRLSGSVPFTLDEAERVAGALGCTLTELLERAS